MRCCWPSYALLVDAEVDEDTEITIVRFGSDAHFELARRLPELRELRVGHGLLMDPDLDVARRKGIWRRECLPLLMSFGVPPEGFDYDTLRPR